MLDGILPAPRGMPQIEVTFDIDANGILNVSAKDKGTGKEQRITITASSGLSQSEIDGMVKDAEAHAEEDKRKREEIDLRNNAENTAYQAEKLLEENKDKVPDDLKEEIEAAVKEVREAVAAEDSGRIKTALDKLQESMTKLGQHVYGQSDEQPKGPDGADGTPPEGGGGTEGKPDGTVEGEYREL
jgi:molecular chaperone DnaK